MVFPITLSSSTCCVSVQVSVADRNELRLFQLLFAKKYKVHIFGGRSIWRIIPLCNPRKRENREPRTENSRRLLQRVMTDDAGATRPLETPTSFLLGPAKLSAKLAFLLSTFRAL